MAIVYKVVLKNPRERTHVKIKEITNKVLQFSKTHSRTTNFEELQMRLSVARMVNEREREC